MDNSFCLCQVESSEIDDLSLLPPSLLSHNFTERCLLLLSGLQVVAEVCSPSLLDTTFFSLDLVESSEIDECLVGGDGFGLVSPLCCFE